jgi:hypothetical protein
VFQSTLAAAVLELVALAVLELLGVVVELLLELLEQPATSKIDPTAAILMAAVALDARKVRPSHAAPRGSWRRSASWLDKWVSWLTKLNGRLPDSRPEPSV